MQTPLQLFRRGSSCLLYLCDDTSQVDEVVEDARFAATTIPDDHDLKDEVIFLTARRLLHILSGMNLK